MILLHVFFTAPTIALAMGERGVITRLLAAKYGGHLTFAAMSPEKASAPGQPDIQLLKTRFNFHVSALSVAVNSLLLTNKRNG